MATRDILVPDIGDFEDVEVIEVLVKPGDTISPEDPLITIESDKASMEIPAPAGGVVRALLVKVGDKVSQGARIAVLEADAEAGETGADVSAETSGARGERIGAAAAAQQNVSAETSPAGKANRRTGAVAEAEQNVSAETLPRRGSGPAGDAVQQNVSAERSAQREAGRRTGAAAAAQQDVSAETRRGGGGVHDAVQQSVSAETSARRGGGRAASPAVEAEDEAAGGDDAEYAAGAAGAGEAQEVRVPDIGDFESVDVIEVLVKAGAEVRAEDPLVTLESDKATMDIPAPFAGTVEKVLVSTGDKVSQGSPIALVRAGAPAKQPVANRTPAKAKAPEAPSARTPPLPSGLPEEREPATGDESAEDLALATAEVLPRPAPAGTATRVHGSPAVRKLARELGVDLARVRGSGRKGRILKEDIKTFVKGALAAPPPAATAGLALPEMPAIDFAKFGDIETRPLPKIRRLSAQHVHRSWLTVPLVTQFDEADITDLEEFRRENKQNAEEQGVKLTMVSFLLKASVVALHKFPEFNASLAPGGEALILKRYYHIGFAVDTEAGLVVPVIRDVNQKGLYQIAGEIQQLSEKARKRKLSPAELQGGCFTISSLGGVGGTAFTPIVNVPEVAILGVSRAATRPVFEDGKFVPRLMLPLSLSYDHRVIDGAAAARFTSFLATVLSDIRKVLL
jgi:pyruvate dehydrogenase E2 component (dihydrolipoamide acetyltransferase)